MAEGLFIVFEGVDGSGKATQSKLLIEALRARGVACEHIEIPAYEKHFFGKLVRECLDGEHGDFVHLDPKIASTLYGCDRLEYAQQIRDWRANGTVIIADRFTSSNQVHQGGKIRDEGERAEFVRWIDQMEHEVLGVPRPDLVVYLSISLGTSMRLMHERKKDTVESDEEYLANSHEAGHWLAGREPNWKVITSERKGELRSIADIHEEIRTLVLDRLNIQEGAR
jgi:dTMP kinase